MLSKFGPVIKNNGLWLVVVRLTNAAGKSKKLLGLLGAFISAQWYRPGEKIQSILLIKMPMDCIPRVKAFTSGIDDHEGPLSRFAGDGQKPDQSGLDVAPEIPSFAQASR